MLISGGTILTEGFTDSKNIRMGFSSILRPAQLHASRFFYKRPQYYSHMKKISASVKTILFATEKSVC